MKQRLLKFRAWAGKKMYYFGLMDLDSGYILGELKLPSLQDCEIMQYTGLKDKNGKEIYEGDIIEIDDTELVIEWENSICGFIAGEKHNSALCKNRKDDTKVIGNIYENSNLLK